MSVRNLTIGLRASLFFALMTLLMVALGGFALLQMQRMHSYSDEVDKNWLPPILASNDIGLATSLFVPGEVPKQGNGKIASELAKRLATDDPSLRQRIRPCTRLRRTRARRERESGARKSRIPPSGSRR